MKVLIVSAFPPDPAPEANHALHLSEQLAKLGISVDVVCKTGSIAATHRNITVHAVIDAWTWADLPRLARCLRQSRPDVVLLLYIGWVYKHHPMITFLPTLCRAVLPGVPCVTQFENVDTGFPPRSLLTRAVRSAIAVWAGARSVHSLFGTLLRDSARIILLSSPHRARLAAHDPDIEDKSVILPPPPLIRFCADDPATARRQARASVGADESDFVLVFWGYVYPGKGVETLLEAVRLARRRNSRIHVAIVGGSLDFPTGPISCADYWKMVRALPETLGIANHVAWTGHFDWNSDTGSRHLHAADACVLPFDYGVTLNNSSLAAASTHGVPVIATELPDGHDEALEHGHNILLCPPRDVGALADAIALISENAELRDRLRRGIGALARDWHSWETMARRLVDVLTEVRGEAHRSRAASDHAHAAPSPPPNPPPVTPEPPLVSVIVAVHNVGKYLSQCLDSLVNQTLRNIEVIVVNDASRDNSGEIIDDYAARYPGMIRVVTCGTNQGLATVRNIGLSAARGDYVAFTDGDDWADIRMCELASQRARDDDADVVIGDATVFYEDSKTFGQFFDQHVRKHLRPEIRTGSFALGTEPRVMLLEPVAWTKLYKRSFLEQHALRFEDGMNSYEDMCFHFSVLLKAGRISWHDEPLHFYRQNRPGQISGRRSRKIFEVFAVFAKIHANLAAWDVSPAIWALLVTVELRQFDWLMRDRVPSRYKREFFTLVAAQLAKIPEAGLQAFRRQANREELAKLLCMRRNWLIPYDRLQTSRRLLFPALYVLGHPNRRALVAPASRRGLRALRRRVVSPWRSFAKRLLEWPTLERRLQALEQGVGRVVRVTDVPSGAEEPFVEVCRIRGQTLLMSRRANSGLPNALWRVEHDVYLSQTVAFRPGDAVVDVGAHVGVFSLYLAKKFPFIRVYAIEPDPMNYACLRRNIELNGVTNVIAVDKAVSGDAHKRRLYVDASFNAWATIDAETARSRRVLRTVDVETITLNALFDEYDIRHCRLLKMTAPGAIRDSVSALSRDGCVDLLCGEVEVDDCSRAQLEMLSWKIARQHFWRLVQPHEPRRVASWIQRMPSEIERSPRRIS